jgi:hypothetical protein
MITKRILKLGFWNRSFCRIPLRFHKFAPVYSPKINFLPILKVRKFGKRFVKGDDYLKQMPKTSDVKENLTSFFKRGVFNEDKPYIHNLALLASALFTGHLNILEDELYPRFLKSLQNHITENFPDTVLLSLTISLADSLFKNKELLLISLKKIAPLFNKAMPEEKGITIMHLHHLDDLEMQSQLSKEAQDYILSIDHHSGSYDLNDLHLYIGGFTFLKVQNLAMWEKLCLLLLHCINENPNALSTIPKPHLMGLIACLAQNSIQNKDIWKHLLKEITYLMETARLTLQELITLVDALKKAGLKSENLAHKIVEYFLFKAYDEIEIIKHGMPLGLAFFSSFGTMYGDIVKNQNFRNVLVDYLKEVMKSEACGAEEIWNIKKIIQNYKNFDFKDIQEEVKGLEEKYKERMKEFEEKLEKDRRKSEEESQNSQENENENEKNS